MRMTGHKGVSYVVDNCCDTAHSVVGAGEHPGVPEFNDFVMLQ